VYLGWAAHPASYAARQSANNSHQEIGCVFSGECFPTIGDGGIVERYCHEGDQFPSSLNGVFSGVVIDRRKNRTVLFNDRYGLERLYLHDGPAGTYFASEAKALLAVLPELRNFDEDGVAEFIAFGSCLNWKTLFRGIRLLEGGSRLTFQNGTCRSRRYFDVSEWETQPVLTASLYESKLQEAFVRVLPKYFGGAAELGISLTGGLDTRMIMACLPKTNRKPVCYTFSGPTGETRDDRLAAAVAASCGLSHQLVRLGTDFLTNYRGYVDRTAFLTDGCAGAMTAHELYLNANARSLAPVRLTGNFGSEVLRGVSTLKRRSLSPRLFSSDFLPVVEVINRQRTLANGHPVTFAAFKEIPWRLFGTLAAAKSQIVFRTPYLDNELVALACRAPLASRASAGPSLRLVRAKSPALAGIPTDRSLLEGRSLGAGLLQRFFAELTFKLDYLYSEGLAGNGSRFDALAAPLSAIGLLGQHKYLLYRTWYRTELAGHVAEVLGDPRTLRLPFWNSRTLSTMARDHIQGRHNYVREIDAVLTLEAVDRLLIRG